MGSVRQRTERKRRVLTQGAPSLAMAIADGVVAKDEDVFLISTADGRIPLAGHHGFGLYHHDCRFLDGYVLDFDGVLPDVLASSSRHGFERTFELSNPELRGRDGRPIPRLQVAMTWERLVDGSRRALHDTIAVHNYGPDPIDVTVRLQLASSFEDVHAVRGLLPEHRGRIHAPRWSEQALALGYDGIDGIQRSTTIRFWTAPESADGTTTRFRVRLETGASQSIALSVFVDEGRSSRSRRGRPDTVRMVAVGAGATAAWREQQTRVETDSFVFGRVLHRSIEDLRMLRTKLGEASYFAAGVPWFVALFGRDAAIAALETLMLMPHEAEETLRVLAAHQGRVLDAWRDEQPGKILHELRVGELARSGQIPHSPYYGSVDSTPLFLILLGATARWTGRLELFEELREHVEAALAWLDQHGDRRGRGYVAYASASEHGLVNQGWKDSGEAIVMEDGELATPPIALVEVQGYAYMARLAIAELFERSGDSSRAGSLRAEAAELRERFNRDFWVEARRCYALALAAGGRPAAVVASNAGHALWTGIADADKARSVAAALMGPDMFTGWGIRTLATCEHRYNPIAYHLGTVWPHDNAIIAAGLRRYGYDDEALRVFDGILDAAVRLPERRLPELFAGFSRDQFEDPVRYPVACHPQAWAAGSIPSMLETALGLQPDAFERRLRITRPRLPRLVDRLELTQLRVGEAEVSLLFRRGADGAIEVDVTGKRGRLEVVLDRAMRSAA